MRNSFDSYAIILWAWGILSPLMPSYAQNVVLLRKAKEDLSFFERKRPYILREGKKIVFTIKNGERKKGEINKIMDSALVVSGDTFSIAEFSMVKFNVSTQEYRSLWGIPCGIAGLFLTYAEIRGIVEYIITPFYMRGDMLFWLYLWSTFLVPAATSLDIAAVSLLFHRKKVYLDYEWKMEIIKKRK